MIFDPRFLGDLTGIDTKSSVPYIKEFRFLFLAGTPLRFNANPLADDLVGEPIKCHIMNKLICQKMIT